MLSAGTHGQIPWPQLTQHSWEERGRQTASPAAPEPCPTAGPGGEDISVEGEWAWTCTQGTCFPDGNSAAGRVVKLLGSC